MIARFRYIVGQVLLDKHAHLRTVISKVRPQLTRVRRLYH